MKSLIVPLLNNVLLLRQCLNCEQAIRVDKTVRNNQRVSITIIEKKLGFLWENEQPQNEGGNGML